MKNKWERREAKEQSKRNFASDNRNSIRLLEKLSLLPDKIKTIKRKKLR